MFSEAFSKNIEWNIEQIAVLIRHAEAVKGRARTGYYKMAIILTASIAEALAYKVLETNNSSQKVYENWQCIRFSPLPTCYVSSRGNNLSICERVKVEFELTTQTDFKRVNEICHKLGIFSKRFFQKIETVRKTRNRIHIQGLEDLDRSYNKRQLEAVSSVVDDLLGILGRDQVLKKGTKFLGN